MHVGRVVGSVHGDSHLRVIDAREVAGTSGLVLLGLEREGVRVHTWVGAASVVVEGLHLVEVLTLLFLESVLTVEDELEGAEGADSLFSEGLATTDTVTEGKQGRTEAGGRDNAVGIQGFNVGHHLDVRGGGRSGEVPQGGRGGGSVGEAPHQFLDGVVVRKADLLGGSRVNSVGTSVLDLLDQVFMTLLGESATLLGVQVDVVSPHLEHGGVTVGVEVGRQVDVHTDFMVLKRDQRQVQTGVAVEEEEQGQVDSLADRRSGHLTVRSLLGRVQVKLRVQTPPLLVVFVDALTTDGQLDVVDRTLGDPARGGVSSRLGLEFDVHVTDKVTVTSDSHGHATGVGGSTVDGLLDVLHREVSVALVFRLEKSYFWVTGKVDVLSAVSYELHETTSHFESCCTIYRENNSGQTRIF